VKLSLAIALAIALPATLSPVASGTQLTTTDSRGSNAVATVPLSPSDRDSRAASSCGDFCVQQKYKNVDIGAWFIDDENELFLAGAKTLSVVNLVTQKTVKKFSAPKRVYFQKVAMSNDGGYALVKLSNYTYWRLDTSTWDKLDVTSVFSMTQPWTFAVSDSGNVFFGASLGTANSPIWRYNLSGLVETHSGSTNQGITWMRLTGDESELFAGMNGARPTVVKLDAGNISAGTTAADNRSDTWGTSDAAVDSNGDVYVSFQSVLGLSDPTAWERRLLKMGNANLTTGATFDLRQDWYGGAVTLSENETRVFAGYDHNPEVVGTGSASRVYSISTGDFEDFEYVELPGSREEVVNSLDADETGRYLIATTERYAFLISLSDAPAIPDVTVTDVLAGVAISWNYRYVNSKAKFKWFEVKYRKAGATRWTVKRVKRGTSMTIPGEVAGGSDAIQVRAVYAKKSFNSGWGTVSLPV
jgi:hypothetical protein